MLSAFTTVLAHEQDRATRATRVGGISARSVEIRRGIQGYPNGRLWLYRVEGTSASVTSPHPTHERGPGATSLAIERFLVAVLNSRERVRLAGDLTTLDRYRLAWP